MRIKYLIILSCFAILLTGCYPYQRVRNNCQTCVKPAETYCANNCCSCYTTVSDTDFLPPVDDYTPPTRRGYKGEGFKGG